VLFGVRGVLAVRFFVIMAIRCSLISIVVLAACAQRPAATPLEAEHASYGDERFEGWQPAPYTPQPALRAQSGDSVALSASGGEEQARSAAVSLVQAMLDADAPALNGLFAERVIFVVSSTAQPRAELIERCLHEARALQYEPDVRIEAVVDASAIEVRRADRQHGDVPLPPGIRASDLLVTLPPPRAASPESLRRIPCLSGVFVRPGAHGSIVGVMR
jgi:hypothetical protein